MIPYLCSSYFGLSSSPRKCWRHYQGRAEQRVSCREEDLLWGGCVSKLEVAFLLEQHGRGDRFSAPVCGDGAVAGSDLLRRSF